MTAGRSGVGLALVHGLVDVHGGFVKAVSEGLGRGARFNVWLPCAAAPGAHSELMPREQHGSPRRMSSAAGTRNLAFEPCRDVRAPEPQPS